MSYPEEIRELAFDFFVAGLSLDGVAERLRGARVDCADVNRKTVGRWAEEGNWKSRAEGVRRDKRAKSDEKRSEELAHYAGELREVVDRTLAQLGTLDAKNFELSIFALNQIFKTYSNLVGLGKGSGEFSSAQRQVIGERLRRALGRVPGFKALMTADNMEALGGELELEFAERN